MTMSICPQCQGEVHGRISPDGEVPCRCPNCGFGWMEYVRGAEPQVPTVADDTPVWLGSRIVLRIDAKGDRISEFHDENALDRYIGRHIRMGYVFTPGLDHDLLTKGVSE